jgi:hypothetical protein
MAMSLTQLKRGVLLFWALWFTLVLATNLCDGAKALGLLAPGWAFASGNFGFIASVTAKYGTPGWINGVLFAGVILWQLIATVLFWRSGMIYRPKDARSLAAATTALGVGLGLWAAFTIADEFFVAYETGVEAVHLRLFSAQFVTLLGIHLLPE